MRSHILRIALPLLLLSPGLWAMPTVQQVVDYIDTNYEIKSDLTAQARITTRDPEQGTKIIESVLYRRDRDDAFLIVIAEPEIRQGERLHAHG